MPKNKHQVGAKSRARKSAVKAGFRSALERRVACQLADKGIKFEYEPETFEYTVPESDHRYTPDFKLICKSTKEAIYVEVKGYMDAKEARKYIFVRDSNEGLDLRFVFQNAYAKMPHRQTSYAQWAEKNGFQWADKRVPMEWVN